MVVDAELDVDMSEEVGGTLAAREDKPWALCWRLACLFVSPGAGDPGRDAGLCSLDCVFPIAVNLSTLAIKARKPMSNACLHRSEDQTTAGAYLNGRRLDRPCRRCTRQSEVSFSRIELRQSSK